MNPVLERTRTTIERSVVTATEAAMCAAPTGKWSAAAILEHLSLTYTGTSRSMSKAMEHGRPIGHRPSVRQRAAQALVVGVGYFPRVDAPAGTKPAGLAPSAALAALRRALAEMDEAIAAAERAFGSHALVADHPLLGGFTPARWRRFHLQHARHHARQIRERLSV